MTLDEIRESSKEILNPSDICDVLGCSAYAITLQAREDAKNGTKSFPFPVIVLGTRTKIPRRPFLRVMCPEEVPT